MKQKIYLSISSWATFVTVFFVGLIANSQITVTLPFPIGVGTYCSNTKNMTTLKINIKNLSTTENYILGNCCYSMFGNTDSSCITNIRIYDDSTKLQIGYSPGLPWKFNMGYTLKKGLTHSFYMLYDVAGCPGKSNTITFDSIVAVGVTTHNTYTYKQRILGQGIFIEDCLKNIAPVIDSFNRPASNICLGDTSESIMTVNVISTAAGWSVAVNKINFSIEWAVGTGVINNFSIGPLGISTNVTPGVIIGKSFSVATAGYKKITFSVNPSAVPIGGKFRLRVDSFEVTNNWFNINQTVKTPTLVGNWMSIIDCQSNGIDEYSDKKPSVKIYPNPAKDFLIIESVQTGTLVITNLEGSVVMEKVISGKEKKSVEFPDNTPKGLYYWKFITYSSVASGKILKN